MHDHGDLSERGTPEEIFGKFRDLEQFNLDEPMITKLFKGLKKEGLDFGDPLRVDEAIESIKKHWDRSNPESDQRIPFNRKRCSQPDLGMRIGNLQIRSSPFSCTPVRHYRLSLS